MRGNGHKRYESKIDAMNSKKTWNSPHLIKYGTVEQLTEFENSDLQRLNQFVLKDATFGLFASFAGL
jgi:hypothetical protein